MTADRPSGEVSEDLAGIVLAALGVMGTPASDIISISEVIDEDPAPVDTLAREVFSERVRKELARGYGEAYVNTHAQEYLKGYLQGRAADVLFLLEARDIPVSDADRDRITTCNDLKILTLWFTRAITATSIAEVLEDDLADTEH
ncbi:hypothetical protein [Streptomyces yerevanensis]|uniref:hypothetical protein n=1 Tax=Streptomyces yerevanensis TaxID=66378 RepID=UPI00068A0A14|nr:hypothetical protein [Streptomyces yerevanensis]